MAKIVDKDQINFGTEAVLDLNAKTWQLLIAGNLDDNSPGKSSGVTWQAWYSALKDEWLANAAVHRLMFPSEADFDAQFNSINGWTHADAQTLDLLRDGGHKDHSTGREYACPISLGTMAASTDQAYYQQVAGFTATVTNFDKTGEVNELIEIFDGGSNDYRGFLKVFVREQGKIPAQGNLLVDQEISALTYRAYRLPLATVTDPNISVADATIDADAPYTGMQISYLQGSGFTTWTNATVYAAGAVVRDPIRQAGGSANGTWWFTAAGGTSSGTGTADDVGVTWEAYAGEIQIGDEWFAFTIILDANNASHTDLYQFTRRQERQAGSINDDAVGAPNQDGFGAVNGLVANPFAQFSGTTLETAAGVGIINLSSSSLTLVKLFDVTVDGGGLNSERVPLTTTARTFPFVSAGTIEFPQRVVDEADINTIFRMYFLHTLRQTGTDLAMTAVTGNAGTLTSTSTDLSVFASGDYMRLSGFANAANNGVFRVTGAGTGTSKPIAKVYNPTAVLVAEVAGATVNVDDDPSDSPDGVQVNDASGSPIGGQITGLSIGFDFDYDGNVQGGRVAGADASVVIFGQGAVTRWSNATFTITRSVGQVINVTMAADIVYAA